MISAPFLLHLGGATDPLSVKTARGLAQWRPEACLGERKLPACTVSLGLPEMSVEQAVHLGARTMVIGEANAGGVLPATLIPDILLALELGLDVASGLHQRLGDIDEIRQAALNAGRSLFDVRSPPADLVVGNGRPRPGRRLLTIGADCSMGKMYTALALERALRARGVAADFRATGQTGILIAGAGVPIDAVVADFISGGAERVSPARTDDGWDVIEGQGSLFHPSYAGVSLGLLHGSQPDALVVCHEPFRPHMRGLPGRPTPSIQETIARNLEAAAVTNRAVQVVGVALNTVSLEATAAARLCAETSAELGLPCQDPVRDGVDQIVDHLLSCFPN